MALAKLDDIKTAMDFGGSTHDAQLTVLLSRATALAEQLARRPLERAADVVEYPEDSDGRVRRIYMRRYPIEAVATIKQLHATGTDSEFSDATALTENEDFVLVAEGRLGVIERINGYWAAWPRHLQVTYTAGYVDPSTASPPAGSIQPPADLQHGIQQQVIRWFNTRDKAGLREIQLGEGGSVNFTETKPHPELVAAVKALRRVEL